MRAAVVGTGYVGLSLGVGLASMGHDVVCVDSDAEKVRLIGGGISPIYEKGLDELLKQVLKKKRFSVTTELAPAMRNAEVTFICVGTPTNPDGSIDLSQIKTVSAQIGEALREKKDYHVVVVKSTVVPLTTSEVVLPILKEMSGKSPDEFGLCMNPEFLREGSAVEDFLNPDRIVIGEVDGKSGEVLERLYADFKVPIVHTTLETAEMIKYTSNSLLGTLISFSNEIADICERTPNVDVVDVLNAVCLDKRLNPLINGRLVNPGILAYLIAGCGFGGSCLPKDINALAAFATDRGCQPRMLDSVLDINQERPLHIIDQAEQELGGLDGKKVAILGLAFKPDSDDVRDSPAIPVVRELLKRGALVSVYDPRAMENARMRLPDADISWCNSLEEAIKDAAACLLITRWAEFSRITPELLAREMKQPVFIDGRRLLNSTDFQGKAKYIGIGLYKNIKAGVIQANNQ